MRLFSKTMVNFFTLALCLWNLPLWPVRFINVTEAPIYFAVYYRKSFEENIVRAIRYSAPKEGFYTATAGGQAFLEGAGYTRYTHLPFIDFKWPGQVCSSKGVFGDCRGHYPRTVLFSFAQQDILAGQAEFNNLQGIPSSYLGRDIGSSLYQGWNVDSGETHFIFYNPFGFDPLYAVYGNKEKGTVIKAGKLNSSEANAPKAYALRRYLIFANYQYFGK